MNKLINCKELRMIRTQQEEELKFQIKSKGCICVHTVLKRSFLVIQHSGVLRKNLDVHILICWFHFTFPGKTAPDLSGYEGISCMHLSLTQGLSEI